MKIDTNKLSKIDGYKIDIISVNRQMRKVATIPGENCRLIVGYMDDTGNLLWVRKDFQK